LFYLAAALAAHAADAVAPRGTGASAVGILAAAVSDSSHRAATRRTAVASPQLSRPSHHQQGQQHEQQRAPEQQPPRVAQSVHAGECRPRAAAAAPPCVMQSAHAAAPPSGVAQPSYMAVGHPAPPRGSAADSAQRSTAAADATYEQDLKVWLIYGFYARFPAFLSRTHLSPSRACASLRQFACCGCSMLYRNPH